MMYAITSADPVLIGEPRKLWGVASTDGMDIMLAALEDENPGVEFDVEEMPICKPFHKPVYKPVYKSELPICKPKAKAVSA